MGEHLYILSNPSVPGVIKIGKTASSLDQKIAELHDTDDPLPLILEFYAEVEDGERSEQAAHSALSTLRVDGDHKFFRVSVPKALEIILPLIGKHTAIDVSASNTPERLAAAVAQRRLAADRRESERLAKEVLRERAERAAKRQRRLEIEAEISQEHRNLRRLGPRPIRPVLPMFLLACVFCFSPSPVGWIVWLGALGVFFSQTMTLGFVSIGLVVLGFLAYRIDIAYGENYVKAMEPFHPVYARILELEQQLRDLVAS